ncbi:MAG: AhpC/TSA family protein [Sphingobacterium sp.]|nr:AhpC/TSA family protein [Sphingobacterium sp.]
MLAALFCFSFNPLFAQISLTIKGKVTGDTKGFNKIYVYNDTYTDSATINVNGDYQMIIKSESSDIRVIYLDYELNTKGSYSPFPLFIAKSGTLNLDFDINAGIPSAVVSGPARSVAYFEFTKAKRSFNTSIYEEALSKFGKDAFKKESSNYKSASDYYGKRMKELSDSLFNKYFDPNEGDAPFILLDMERSLSLEQLESNFSKISVQVKETKGAKQLEDKINSMKRSSIGSTVANFVLPDTSGNDFSFSKLRGKYVLIDFWASWCGPCRTSFPRLRSVYQQLKGKNFEIINISIDAKLDDWKKALKEESNPWP